MPRSPRSAGSAHWLGEIFGAARAAGQGRYGYAEHSVDTTYLGSSTGLRLRHAQPAVRLELTGRTADGTRSAWSGQGCSEVAAHRPRGARGRRRASGWRGASGRSRSTPAATTTILPPSAVADLMVYAYWSAGALDAHEGQSVFSKAGGGTRVGERLTDVPLTLRSRPGDAGPAVRAVRRRGCVQPDVVGVRQRRADRTDRLDPRRRAGRADPDPALGRG